jgi:hypothetical protein
MQKLPPTHKAVSTSVVPSVALEVSSAAERLKTRCPADSIHFAWVESAGFFGSEISGATSSA